MKTLRDYNSIRICTLAFDHAQGLLTDKIVDKYSELQYRYEAVRMIRKALKVLVEKYQVSSIKRRILDSEN